MKSSRKRQYWVAFTGVLVTTLVVASVEAATLYRWTDAYGTTHFSTERPDTDAPVTRLNMDSTSSGSASRTDVGDDAAPSPALRERRCEGFRGALTQLRSANDVKPAKAAWREAKQLANKRIEQWCN